MTDINASDLRRRLQRLTISPDAAVFVLGRADLGRYVVVPEPGAVVVKVLQDGGSLADAADRAGDVAGQAVDVEDFLTGLAEAGLLGPAGRADDRAGAQRGHTIRWIEGISPRAARPLFGVAGWTAYTACFVFAAVAMIGRPDLRPTWESFWFLPDPPLCLLILVAVQLVMGAGHEMWHWLAGRAVGVPAIFRVSYRGVLVVFETDLTQMVTLPRRQRYGPFLAGMALDSTVLAAALGLRWLYAANVVSMPAVLSRLLGAIVLLQSISIATQWLLMFARSDAYAVLANALGCHNLYRTTWLTAKRRLWPLSTAEEADLAATADRDRSVARWFAAVYVAGMLGMVWLLLNIGLPSAIALVTWIGPNLVGLAIGTVAFWESVAIAVCVAANYALPPMLARRERALRRSGALL
jgi:putative peptide zinc metalloprotease protein